MTDTSKLLPATFWSSPTEFWSSMFEVYSDISCRIAGPCRFRGLFGVPSEDVTLTNPFGKVSHAFELEE